MFQPACLKSIRALAPSFILVFHLIIAPNCYYNFLCTVASTSNKLGFESGTVHLETPFSGPEPIIQVLVQAFASNSALASWVFASKPALQSLLKLLFLIPLQLFKSILLFQLLKFLLLFQDYYSIMIYFINLYRYI